MSQIRTERTFGVTGRLSEEKRGALATIRTHPGYQALLDILEQTCIEQESRLINRDVTDPEAIVAEHRKTQAMWQMFTHMQEAVDREVGAYNEHILPRREPEYTQEQMDIDELLDPTRHYNSRA